MQLYDKILGHLYLLQEMKKAGVSDTFVKDYKEEALFNLCWKVRELDAKDEISSMKKEAVEYLVKDPEFLLYLVRLLREGVCNAMRAGRLLMETYADETSQKILAYAVEVMDIEDKKVVGNLYPLDYRKHAEFVKAASIPADRIRVVYETGERIQNRGKRICRDDDKIHGKFQYLEYVPNGSGALESALCQEENDRRKMQSGKIENHIRKLVAS